MKQKILFLFLLLVLFFPLSAIAGLDLPNAKSYVNDFAGILSNTQILEQQISAYEQETSNEIAIVTVGSLQDTTIEEYAVRLFEKWKIGKADKDNGILILVAPNERQIRIEVGYGLEGALPDSLASSIIQREILPSFKNMNYQTGVENGVLAVIQAAKDEYQGQDTATSQPASWQKILAGLIPFIIFIILIILSSRKGGGKGLPWLLLGMFLGRGFGGGSSGPKGRGGFGGFGSGSSGGGGSSGSW